MSTNEDEDPKAAEAHDKEASEDAPTFYLIQFPNYHAHTWSATDSDLIWVHRKSLLTDTITARIEIPLWTFELRYSTLLSYSTLIRTWI